MNMVRKKRMTGIAATMMLISLYMASLPKSCFGPTCFHGVQRGGFRVSLRGPNRPIVKFTENAGRKRKFLARFRRIDPDDSDEMRPHPSAYQGLLVGVALRSERAGLEEVRKDRSLRRQRPGHLPHKRVSGAARGARRKRQRDITGICMVTPTPSTRHSWPLARSVTVPSTRRSASIARRNRHCCDQQAPPRCCPLV